MQYAMQYVVTEQNIIYVRQRQQINPLLLRGPWFIVMY